MLTAKYIEQTEIQKSNPLFDIYEKIRESERLSFSDGVRLYKTADILTLALLAETAKITRLRSKDREAEKYYVYWINNHHINLTNICEGSCKFCAFRKKSGEIGSYIISLEEAEDYIKTKISNKVSELHIVSGLNPELDIEYYKNLFKICKKNLPQAHIQALTAVEADYLAKKSSLSVKETLQELIKAGLDSMPGGGAEIFSPDVRQKVCPEKITGERWLEIMETAHSLGIKSNATMLTGIGESLEDKISHLHKLRELQDKTQGFMSFIPLFCHYENTLIKSEYETSGIDTVKEYALARLMLDNFWHIKSFRIQTGTNLAQLSLFYGSDDLDGTVITEKITRSAGAKTDGEITSEELTALIKNAGKTPVQRDTLYNIIKVY